MPKPRSSLGKKPALRQVKLDFSAKRGAPAKGKGVKSATSSANVSKSSSPISIDDSEEDEDFTVTLKPKKITSTAGPAAKRRKIESETPEKGKAIFKLTDDVEDAGGDSAAPSEERPPLYPNDKRWTKVHARAKTRMGNVEPVHSKGLNKVHHILRVFDLSYEFGPCVGVSRLQRWERAHALGLTPPAEIKEILTTRDGAEKEEYSQSVFYGDL